MPYPSKRWQKKDRVKPQFELVRCSNDSSFGSSKYEGAVFDCPYHVHPEIEILLIEAGRGRYLVGDKIGRFQPQDIFVFAPNLPHMFDSDTPRIRRGSGVCSRYIQFKKDCLGTRFLDLPELRKIRRLLQHSSRGLGFLGGKNPKLIERFYAAHMSTGAAKIALLLIFLESLTATRAFQPLASAGYLFEQTHRDSERLERAFVHIHRHFSCSLTLTDTARAACFSPQAFSRFFHRHIGITFQNYVIDLRLMEACRLLIETDQTVAEICFRIGFNNLSNFNRHFLARKKIAPLRYRQLASPRPTE